MIEAGEKAYCQNCGDRYSDEAYCFGWCCGKEMMSRPYTTEEVALRRRALERIIERSRALSW